MPPPDLILFDGVCNLCAGFVQFVIARDPRGRFRFAALQSAAGQGLLAAHGLAAAAVGGPDSVVLLPAAGGVLTHSAAGLAILRGLGGGWAALGRVVSWFPKPVRDAVYRFIARHRYRWFGRKAECWLPTPTLQARFL